VFDYKIGNLDFSSYFLWNKNHQMILGLVNAENDDTLSARDTNRKYY